MNKPFEHIVIVSDVDGTIAPSFYELPQRNIEALQRFRALGGFFTIATGRSLYSAKEVIEKLEIRGPVILVNGGCIYDTASDTFLYDRYLDDEARNAFDQLVKCPGLLELRVMTDVISYVVYRKPGVDESPYVHSKNHMYRAAIEDISDKPWRKFLLVADPEDMDRICEQAAKICGEHAFVTKSSPYFGEVLPFGVNKGAALDILVAKKRYRLEDVIAMGDYNNDLELLQAAGVAVAPANALPQIQANANLVVCSAQEGALADVIERLEAMYQSDETLINHPIRFQ